MADIELVIKISKRVYNYIRKYEHIANSDVLDIKDAIINGTPIPDNATNGDVIKAIFPQAYVDESRYETPFIDVMYEGEVKSFSETWWNSPYQKGEQ